MHIQTLVDRRTRFVNPLLRGSVGCQVGVQPWMSWWARSWMADGKSEWMRTGVPSGKLTKLVKITIFNGKNHYDISMAIFNSYVRLPEGTSISGNL